MLPTFSLMNTTDSTDDTADEAHKTSAEGNGNDIADMSRATTVLVAVHLRIALRSPGGFAMAVHMCRGASGSADDHDDAGTAARVRVTSSQLTTADVQIGNAAAHEDAASYRSWPCVTNRQRIKPCWNDFHIPVTRANTEQLHKHDCAPG